MTTGKFTLVIRWPSGQSTICGEMTDHQHGEICRILSPDYRAQPIQGGEAVEVVAWRHWGDKTRLLCDLGKQRAIPGTIADEFTVPLMTVAQHQRILAASVGSAEPVAWAICKEPGRVDWLSATYANKRAAEAHVESHKNDLTLYITPLYTHPADQVADDLTMVKVSREFLQDLRDLAFDQVEHHRAAMGAYKQTRQSAMDSVLAQADALLRS